MNGALPERAGQPDWLERRIDQACDRFELDWRAGRVSAN